MKTSSTKRNRKSVRQLERLEDIPLQPGKKNNQDGPADRGLMNQHSTVPGDLGHRDRKKELSPSSRITPGSAEGDLETNR